MAIFQCDLIIFNLNNIQNLIFINYTKNILSERN